MTLSNSIDFSSTTKSGGTAVNGRLHSRSISSVCGHCDEKVVFTLSWSSQQLPNSSCASGKCPSCQKLVDFFFCFGSKQDGKSKLLDVVQFPKTGRIARIQIPEDVPERIKKAIRETEQTFAAGLPAPTLTCGRRALEGIFKHLQQDDASNLVLAKLIDRTLENEEAGKPLRDLSHAIRLGGNQGAHFDLDKDPDNETAELILSLLQYLVAYFFSMPEAIKQLEMKIQKK